MRPNQLLRLAVIVACAVLASAHRRCGHSKVAKRNAPTSRRAQTYAPMHSGRRSDEQWQPIRITMKYDCSRCVENNGKSSKQQEYVKKIVGRAEKWLESVLKVRPVTTHLKVRNGDDADEWDSNDEDVPDEYYTTGIPDTDLLIFVMSSHKGQEKAECTEDNYEAFAKYLETDQYSRPAFGWIDMCAATINGEDDSFEATEGDFHTAVHEIVHVLGFNEELYPYFRDENNQPRTPLCTPADVDSYEKDNTACKLRRDGHCFACDTVDEVPWNVTHGKNKKWPLCDYLVYAAAPNLKKGEEYKYLTTPKLLEVAREHFGCPTWPGVALEDDGGDATAGSHFDRRMVMNEFMEGAYAGFPIKKSKFTLAFLEDTGWYRADFTQAEQLVWGYNHGCKFFSECSVESSKSMSPGSVCTVETPSTLECTHDRSGFGVCHKEDKYMDGCHFVDPREGDSDNEEDGFICSNWGDYDVSKRAPFLSERAGSVPSYSTSKTWRCFSSDLKKGSAAAATEQKVGCYDARCTKVAVTMWKLEIKDPNGAWQVCAPDKKLSVSGYAGAIDCPPEWDTLCLLGAIPTHVDLTVLPALDKATSFKVQLELGFAKELTLSEQTKVKQGIASAAMVSVVNVELTKDSRRQSVTYTSTVYAQDASSANSVKGLLGETALKDALAAAGAPAPTSVGSAATFTPSPSTPSTTPSPTISSTSADSASPPMRHCVHNSWMLCLLMPVTLMFQAGFCGNQGIC